MASSGTPRHSKKNSPGVTIELAPADVTSVSDELDVKDIEADDIQAEPSAAAEAPQAEETAQEVRPSPAATAAPARGLSSLTGGLIGGALALAAGAGLQWGGLLPTFGSDAEIAALRREIAVLSEKSGAPAIDSAVIDGLKSGQEAVMKEVETLGADLSAAKETQKSLSDEVAALKSSGGAPGGDSSALTEKLAALETRLNSLSGNDASARLADMQAQIAALKQSAGNETGASNVAQAIAAAGLKAAIDRGGSFASELETFATVAPASPELEQLKNLAAAGVPSKVGPVGGIWRRCRCDAGCNAGC